MKPEPVPTPGPDRRRTVVDWLALSLLMIAADQGVRVIEALAATLVRQALRVQRGPAPVLTELAPALSGLAPTPFPGSATIGDFSRKLQLCRRIARRAIHGSLLDPTLGATAFHRIDETPAWSRNLLPVAAIGSFLFYELADPERAADANADRETPAERG